MRLFKHNARLLIITTILALPLAGFAADEKKAKN